MILITLARKSSVEEPELLLTAVNRLAILGERAGFTVSQLIRLLNAGITVEGLLQLIEAWLASRPQVATPSARWIV